MMPDLIPKLLRLAAKWDREAQDDDEELDFHLGRQECVGEIIDLLKVRLGIAGGYRRWTATLDSATGTGSTRAEALCALAAELEGRQQDALTGWRETALELPPAGVRVLVCDNDGLMTLAQYHKGQWWFFDGKSIPSNLFDLWHPLPAPARAATKAGEETEKL